ncbi:IclR family transcriptional regulator [uncultured Alsobacter sp.]|uniref:IclR family transcriptional regulator n=1 Tax=uncultured Alsobacter sp. TaxID=1748258 RepID=UPI0025EEB9BE|nr:IclR family transcriptional regulator [uncultured Alsobacter sp.]
MTILDAASDVLRCFTAERRELTVTDVCALRGAPKSSTSRLLRAMRDAGLLETVGDSKRYRPSILLFELGQAYRAGSTLLARAHEVVSGIVDQVGHTGYVSMREGLDVMGLAYMAGRNILRVGTPIGRRLPLAASATGRTLLARLGDDEIRALYPGALPQPSPLAPRDLDELLARIATVRARGYEVSDGEANPGVGAIASAVGDPDTGEVVSLCVTYPAATVTPAERSQIIDGLVDGACAIATVLGDTRCAALIARGADK